MPVFPTIQVVQGLRLGPQDRLVDIGAGNGTFTNSLIDRVGMSGATIVEPSKEFAAGVEQFPHIKMVHSTLGDWANEAPAVNADRFDCVLLKEVVHHLGGDEQRRASLSALRSRLEPGGRVLIVTRNHEQPDIPLFDAARTVWRENQPTASELVADLEASGFAKVRPTEASLSYEMTLNDWCKLVRGRLWSTFSHFSDAELNSGIAEIRGSAVGESVTIGDRLVLISAAVETIAEATARPQPTRNPNLGLLTRQAAIDMLAPITSVRGSDPEFEGSRGSWWWTGRTPQSCPGWSAEKGHLTSLPLINLETCTRAQAIATFELFGLVWASFLLHRVRGASY